ncbi:MAG: tetratricopeptide repeat protein [Bacteroidales bacterium]|nr:tetratricopeptide repeat protein [Bacteroidales bacterium]
MKRFFNDNRSNPWFWTFIVLAAALLFAMPLLSSGAGNSGDEDGFQIPQGENVLNYYRTHGADTTCFTFENLKYYGCSFDVVMAWLNHTFGVDDIAHTRHAANALLGWVAVLFVGLIAWRIGGWRAGVVAMALMFLSPRFLGHSFNNPKDIPLAAAVTMSIYYTLMFFRQAPRPKIFTMVMLAISLAFAISVRVGGLIIIGYMGLWGLLWLIQRLSTRSRQTAPKRGGIKNSAKEADEKMWLWKTVGWAALVCVVGFFAGLLLWPYAMQAPIRNTVDSFHAMSQFAIGIRQIYEGHMVWSDALPWYYTPKFIITTIPIAVIIGWLIWPLLPCTQSDKSDDGQAMARYHWVEKAMLYFCFLFPVFWIAYTKANVYGGWRHSLFAYPPMVASAALGFDALTAWLGRKLATSKPVLRKAATVAATALPFLLVIGPAAHIVRNHPYEYVYFNRLSGGTAKAYGQYEMDYYYHSMREATKWVVDHADASALAPGQKVLVGSWHVNSTAYFLRNDTTQFRQRFVRWRQRGDYDWDYAVFPLTGISPAQLTNSAHFPPQNTVHQIKVDGVPIAIVLKRLDKSDYQASQMLKAGRPDSAEVLYLKALEKDPYNESAIASLTNLYINLGRTADAKAMCKRFAEIDPDDDMMNYWTAYVSYLEGRPNEALEQLRRCKELNFKNTSVYRLIAQIYMQQGDQTGAEGEIVRALQKGVIDNNLVELYINIQKGKGLNERVIYYNLYNAIATGLESSGKKEEAKQYREAMKRM